MSGFTAGLFSVATLLVGAAIVTTLVKNASGSASVIQAATSGFASLLTAAQGMGGGLGSSTFSPGG